MLQKNATFIVAGKVICDSGNVRSQANIIIAVANFFDIGVMRENN